MSEVSRAAAKRVAAGGTRFARCYKRIRPASAFVSEAVGRLGNEARALGGRSVSNRTDDSMRLNACGPVKPSQLWRRAIHYLSSGPTYPHAL
ncbi:hypothetical protein J2R99_003209 [Rhodopseudomonas julia]|uniref:Transposase n=1 Tax=Rhodopseudomonas julia TaxID=200617 RepID=A0ABU0C9Y2_9BRAD|nr:hypothetical protein [Rhodopseudomonas julia]